MQKQKNWVLYGGHAPGTPPRSTNGFNPCFLYPKGNPITRKNNKRKRPLRDEKEEPKQDKRQRKTRPGIISNSIYQKVVPLTYLVYGTKVDI